MGYLRSGARAGSSHWVGKNAAFPLHPHFKPPHPPTPASALPPRPHSPFPAIHEPGPPSQPRPPTSPPPQSRATTPAPPPRPPSFPAYSWHPFLLFILTNWRPTPAAPQCAPHPVQQILRKARPALAQPQQPGGGRGRPGAAPAPPALPVLAALTEPAGPARRAGGRGAGEGAVSGSRLRWRCPGARVPYSAGRRGQTLDVAKPPPPSPTSPGEGAQCPEGATEGTARRPSEI